MFKLVTIAVLLSAGFVTVGSLPAQDVALSSTSQSTGLQEPWQKEFDDVCSKTEDAMTFSQTELAQLIARCDALQPQIQKLDDTRRKVYLERLRMCRGLYVYVLDSKKRHEKK